MARDINNNFTGDMFGLDRLGMVTPDADAADPLRPFLPIPYPAPWLPIKRRDEGHPIGAGIVISSHQLVGFDKNGGLVPAGIRSGTQATIAGGGEYYVLRYGADDVGLSYNAETGVLVAAAGELAWLAAPSDGILTNTVTFADGTVSAQIGATSLTNALAGDLIPGGVGRAAGYAIRNVWQFLGGVNVSGASGGIVYTLDSTLPTKFKALNYMHEMGTAIQTQMELRLPWIGATLDTLDLHAATDSVTDYVQGNFSRSFVHFTATQGDADGELFRGSSVVASDRANGEDAGNYSSYDSSIHTPDQIVGHVVGIEEIFPIRDYANRVRTQFERNEKMMGPFAETNKVTGLMGGSATRGIDYAINVTTNGIFRKAKDQGKTLRPEYFTYVYVRVLR